MSPVKDFIEWPNWAKAMVILLAIIAFCSTFRLVLEVL